MVASKKSIPSYIGQNLKFLRTRDNKTMLEMADFLSLKGKSSFQAYEDGRALPDIHKLMKLAAFFNVSLENLVYKDISIEKDLLESEETYFEIELIPTKIAAGYMKGFNDPEYINRLEKIKIPYKPYGIARAFEISGDSMEPLISNGATVIGIKTTESLIKDNKPYIVVTSDGPVCKNIRFAQNETTIYLISKNETYPPKHIEKSDVIEIWEVWKII
jgi:phage repressor protein C with HTH and peptisase S24 domain